MPGGTRTGAWCRRTACATAGRGRGRTHAPAARTPPSRCAGTCGSGASCCGTEAQQTLARCTSTIAMCICLVFCMLLMVSIADHGATGVAPAGILERTKVHCAQHGCHHHVHLSSFSSSLRQKGNTPVSSTYSSTPADQMSLILPWYRLSISTCAVQHHLLYSLHQHAAASPAHQDVDT